MDPPIIRSSLISIYTVCQRTRLQKHFSRRQKQMTLAVLALLGLINVSFSLYTVKIFIPTDLSY